LLLVLGWGRGGFLGLKLFEGESLFLGLFRSSGFGFCRLFLGDLRSRRRLTLSGSSLFLAALFSWFLLALSGAIAARPFVAIKAAAWGAFRFTLSGLVAIRAPVELSSATSLRRLVATVATLVAIKLTLFARFSGFSGRAFAISGGWAFTLALTLTLAAALALASFTALTLATLAGARAVLAVALLRFRFWLLGRSRGRLRLLLDDGPRIVLVVIQQVECIVNLYANKFRVVHDERTAEGRPCLK